MFLVGAIAKELKRWRGCAPRRGRRKFVVVLVPVVRFFPDYAVVCIYVLTPKSQGGVENVVSNEYPSQLCEAKDEGCNYNKQDAKLHGMELDKYSRSSEKSSNSLPVMHSTQ